MTNNSDLLNKLMLLFISIVFATSCGGKVPEEIDHGANVMGQN
jgi:hypothetical protein